MKQSTVAPRRPTYEEPPRLNRRIYYRVIFRVRSVVDWVVAACGELLCFLLGLMASCSHIIGIGLFIFACSRCSTDNSIQQSSQASKPIQAVSTVSHRSKGAHRLHRARPMRAASVASAASHAG